jgi:hypothetical protein
MNWDAISAIAETTGVLLVIASLFYIAAQLRQNSSLLRQNIKLAKASMIHQTNVSAIAGAQQTAQSGELASILLRGKSGQELDDVEKERYLAVVEIQLTWLEDIRAQYEMGLFFEAKEDDEPDPVEDMVPFYSDLLRPEFVKEWWENGARFYFSPSFRLVIEDIMARIKQRTVK